MANIENQQNQKTDEKTIWELLNIVWRNKVLFIIIVILCVAVGAVYSFVFQSQNEVRYAFSEFVLYDEWDYYPIGIDFDYAKQVKAYIEEKAVKPCFISIALKDRNSNDDKFEFYLQGSFLASVDKNEAEELSLEIVNRHNAIIYDEYERVFANKEAEVNELLNKYAEDELEYESFVGKENDASTEAMTEMIVLESQKNVSYELWKTAAMELEDMKYDYNNIDQVCLSPFSLNASTISTWKSNLAVAAIAGCFAAIALIFLKESYLIYRKNKKA